MNMRLLAAAAALVSGAVHLKLWFDGTRDLDVVGPAFLVNAVAGLVIAVLLLTWRHWAPLLLVVGFGVSTLGAFIISTTVGLYGVNASWSGIYTWAAAVSEVVAIVAGLLAARAEGYLRSLRQRQHGLPVGGQHLD
ncbi:hypothetical protein [Nocardioides sp. InS609-2]|uniref:hypothetical protein n=1 Tax=Nocardioides sp. InS609-2 TaxID=2760705 RepID=UPI0020C172EF|nr:hypothetical protein [Nocardioides sp. InS609-2]